MELGRRRIFPRAPLGAQAPPIPAHLWERQAPREARRARAAKRHCVLSGLGGLCRGTGRGEGALRAGSPMLPT